jgi:hypothetical protein
MRDQNLEITHYVARLSFLILVIDSFEWKSNRKIMRNAEKETNGIKSERKR